MQPVLPLAMIQVHEPERAISELDDIDQLVRTHRARLLRFVAFSIRDGDTASSIVQDCFLKAYNSRAQFRGECSISTWLTTIAVNQIRDHQRIRKFQYWRKAGKTAVDVVEMASVLPSGERTPEQHLLARERARAVAEVVDRLSDRQRLVFLMRFSEEMEVSEIASATGMPVNTVKTHLHRAITAVRGHVGAKHK